MPAALLHVTALERLAADASGLPRDVARALAEDLPYARLGALLPDLPAYAHGLGPLGGSRAAPLPPLARLLHERAPVTLGLKMAELVAAGALVGTEPGLALVTGYFSHLVLDRALHPTVERLVARHRRRGQGAAAAHRDVEWAQALFYAREWHGREVLGTPLVREAFRLTKREAFPWHGVGGGLYEVVRLAASSTLGVAPTKAELDRWVRLATLAGRVLSSPLGRAHALPAVGALSERELYRSESLDLAREVDAALEETRVVLRRLCAYMARGVFTPRARARFLAHLPDGTPGMCAA